MKIAIDGPGGAGKSTIAKALAKQLGIFYVDTGAMYRCCAYKARELDIDVRDESAVARLMQDIQLGVAEGEVGPVLSLDGRVVGEEIRTAEISKLASDISAQGVCRAALTEIQRDLAKKHDLVMDGRDIGTVVLPDADLKIFLTASAEERARRRHLENQAKGIESVYEQVLADLHYRDQQDSERPIAPLKQANDAIAIVSDGMDVEAVLAKTMSLVEGLKTNVLVEAEKAEEVAEACGTNPKKGLEQETASASCEQKLEQQSKESSEDDRQHLKGSQRKQEYFGARDESVLWREPKIDPIDRQPDRCFWTRVLLWIVYGILRCIYRLEIHGRENLTGKGPFLAVGNHQSFVDIPVMVKLIRPYPYMVAKRALFKKALTSKFFYGFGAFPVDLDRPNIKTVKRIMTVIRRGGVVGMYPEGTRLIAAQRAGDVQAMTGAVYFAKKLNCPFVMVSMDHPLKRFKKNRVFISKPVTLEDLGMGLENPSNEALTARLMQRIYEQIGQVYEVDGPALRAELGLE